MEITVKYCCTVVRNIDLLKVVSSKIYSIKIKDFRFYWSITDYQNDIKNSTGDNSRILLFGSEYLKCFVLFMQVEDESSFLYA